MGRPLRKLTPYASTQHRFGAELRRFRKLRGMSQAELGLRIMHSGSTVSKVEKAERWPSREFAFRSDEVLRAEGSLTVLWIRAQEERTDQVPTNTQGEMPSRPANEEPLLDEILRIPAADRKQLCEFRRLADRITADLTDLRAIVAEHREGAPLRRKLEEAISLLAGATEPSVADTASRSARRLAWAPANSPDALRLRRGRVGRLP
ncbi:helix-turn-helix transcriptional regulator [Streptomyces sp. NPDC020858]|uniref:helix-turn-helix transcriptional regulator n=1 Tax=Streptomyces sp. NPDC020858 TaxID=3365097 RepID=UPI0037A301E4